RLHRPRTAVWADRSPPTRLAHRGAPGREATSATEPICSGRSTTRGGGRWRPPISPGSSDRAPERFQRAFTGAWHRYPDIACVGTGCALDALSEDADFMSSAIVADGGFVDLRLDVVSESGRAVVRIQGRLAGGAVTELERVCRSTPGPLVLDLTHLM